MASQALKGLTIKIGADTSELSKALDSVDKKSRSLSSELGHINRALKFDPSNTELLAQKQKVLADAVSNTEDRLKTLREAEQQVQAQFERGEVSEEQYRALRREIIETENKLSRYKKAVQETSDAAEQLANATDDSADELKDHAKQANKAADAAEDLDASLSDTAKGGFAALTAAAGAALAAIVATDEASREYRAEMGKLDAAYASSKHSTDTAKKAYKELQSVIGETDQSVEAAQQIALLASSAEGVTKWAGLAAGVVGKFGDALQPETFYESANETLKLGQATGAYTQMLEGCGKNVEEFNTGLQACTTTEEKQAYMLQVTEELLGSAAARYKQTNSEIIRSNAVTDRWNASIAGIGKVVAPVINDFKELGAAAAEDAAKPIEKAATFVRSKLLPALTSAGSWAKQNLPAIKAGLAGLTAAMVAYKAATIATELATKGWTVATLAAAAAQKVMNAAMAAGPYGLAATAIIGLTAALAALCIATQDASERADILTEADRELMEAANAAAEAFREQKKATDEALGDVTAEWGNTQRLANELRTLADESGNVDEKNRSRAQFILSKLNEALGTEYKLVGNVIEGYGNLSASIDEAIRKELAFALTEEMKDDYVAAYKEKAQALENMNLAHLDYQAQIAITEQHEKRITEEIKKLEAEKEEARKKGSQFAGVGLETRIIQLESELQAERDTLEGKKNAWEEATQSYNGYMDTIFTYEAAEAAALEGNYEQAVELMTKKGESHHEYADTVDAETARALDVLQTEAIDAGLYADWMKERFQSGVTGFSQPMVDEAKANYGAAMRTFENAFADAHSVGTDMANGMTAGAESKRPSLIAKARSLVQGFLSAARAALDSHSPSRKTMKIFEDAGDGAVIGTENKTQELKRAAANQVAEVLDVYSSQEVTAQKAIRNVAEQQTVRQTAGQMAVASANSPMLERILAAIEAGQVLLLDGDTLVGGTADRIDRRLGQLRVLSARGAR